MGRPSNDELIGREIAARVRPQWTTRPPKTPGFYWTRSAVSKDGHAIAELQEDGRSWRMFGDDPDWPMGQLSDLYEVWSERIAPPT